MVTPNARNVSLEPGDDLGQFPPNLSETRVHRPGRVERKHDLNFVADSERRTLIET